MDTALHTVSRRSDVTVHPFATSPSPAPRTLPASASFRLSEAGRKASLLAGGNGRAIQDVVVDVPVGRLHLVHVTAAGKARLKLQPRFELRDDARIVRIGAPPVYDAPPTIDALFQEAARNHQLEATYLAQRTAVATARDDATDAWRTQVAEAFLSDSQQRAMVHRSPTSRHCEIATARGRIRFDAKRDRGIARDVAPEAFRRFQADLRQQRDRGTQRHADQVAAHAERRRAVTDWVAAHGTTDQQSRLAAGVLPLDEGIDSMAAHAFRSLGHLPAYEHDGATRLQSQLRAYPEFASLVVAPGAFTVSSRALSDATAAQWALMQEVVAAVPGVAVRLIERVIASTQSPHAPKLRMVTVVATTKVGPLTLRREFLASSSPLLVRATDGDASV